MKFWVLSCKYLLCTFHFSLFSEDNIPDADFIETVRRKRLLARAESNYIPLNISGGDSVQQKEIGDEGSEDESDDERITFAPKLKGPRQRTSEYTGKVQLFVM